MEGNGGQNSAVFFGAEGGGLVGGGGGLGGGYCPLSRLHSTKTGGKALKRSELKMMLKCGGSWPADWKYCFLSLTHIFPPSWGFNKNKFYPKNQILQQIKNL